MLSPQASDILPFGIMKSNQKFLCVQNFWHFCLHVVSNFVMIFPKVETVYFVNTLIFFIIASVMLKKIFLYLDSLPFSKMYLEAISSELGLLHIPTHLPFFSLYPTAHILCLEIKPLLSVFMRIIVADNYYTTVITLLLMIQFV